MLASAGLHAFWNWLVADARDSHAVGAVALLTAAVVFAPVAALTWEVDAAAWPYIAASAALELAYFALLAAAYERADLSFVYPIARGAAPVLVLLVSLAALGADLSVAEAAGVLAIAAGVLLVRGVGRGAARTGLVLALGVAACIAAYTLVDDEGVRHAAALSYFEAVLLITAPVVRRGGGAGPRRRGAADGRHAPLRGRRRRHVRRLRPGAGGARDRRGRPGRRAARDQRGDGHRGRGDRRARASCRRGGWRGRWSWCSVLR